MSTSGSTYPIKYKLPDGSQITGTLELSADSLLLRSDGQSPSLVTIPYSNLAKSAPSKDLETTKAAQRYFLRVECSTPFYAEGKVLLFQCLNPAGYDEETPGAFESSPAAKVKAYLAQKLRQIIRQQATSARSTSSEAVDSKSQTTSAQEASGGVVAPQPGDAVPGTTAPPRSRTSTITPSKPQISSADRFDRARALDENPKLKETYTELVVKDRVVSEEDFWDQYSAVVDLIRAESDQPVMSTMNEILGLVPGLSSGFSKPQSDSYRSAELIAKAAAQYLTAKPPVDPRTVEFGRSLLADTTSWAPAEMRSEHRATNAAASARTADDKRRFMQYDNVIRGLNALGVMTSNQISATRGDITQQGGYQQFVDSRLQTGALLQDVLREDVDQQQQQQRPQIASQPPSKGSHTTTTPGEGIPAIPYQFNEMVVEASVPTITSHPQSHFSPAQTTSTVTPGADKPKTSSGMDSDHFPLRELFESSVASPYAVVAPTSLTMESLTVHGNDTSKRKHSAVAYALLQPKSFSETFDHVVFHPMPDDSLETIPTTTITTTQPETSVASHGTKRSSNHSIYDIQQSIFSQHNVAPIPFKRPRVGISRAAVIDQTIDTSQFPTLLEFTSSPPTSDTVDSSNQQLSADQLHPIQIPLYDVLPAEILLASAMPTPAIAMGVLSSTIPSLAHTHVLSTEHKLSRGDHHHHSSSKRDGVPPAVEKFISITAKLCSFYWQAVNTPKTVKIMGRITTLKKELEAMKTNLTTQNSNDQVLQLSVCDRMIGAVSSHFRPL